MASSKYTMSNEVMFWLRSHAAHKKIPTAMDISLASNIERKEVIKILYAMETLGHVVVQKKEGYPTRFKLFIPN
jgi:hypothetical protein